LDVGAGSSAEPVQVTVQLVLGQAVRSLDFPLRHRQRIRIMATPTIRDLVSALRRRDGVVAAIVLGRDGLLIDGDSTGTLDPDGLAAHVPPMAVAAAEMGRAAGRGDFGLMVLEYAQGSAIVSSLSHEALLLVLLEPAANLPSLLYDLRRHRAQLSALV
jgi:uncharacterized protein